MDITLLVRSLGADGPGGAGRVSVNLANGLANNGHQIDIISPSPSGVFLDKLSSEVSLTRLDQLPLPAFKMAGAIPSLRDYLNKTEIDAMISFMSDVNIVAVLSKIASQREFKLILTEHNNVEKRFGNLGSIKKNVLRGLVRRSYPKSDKIISVSDGVKKSLLTIDSITEDLVTTIYNPIVDDELIRRSVEEPPKELSALDSPIILSVGRLTAQKNFSLLLRAFSEVTNEISANLVIIGSGPKEDELKELADELSISNKVKFITYVDNPFVYMAEASVFVLSSNYEGFGNVVVEAMACGCPIVSTDCPSGPAEILCGGKYGHLVPVNDVKSMKSAIVESIMTDCNDESLRNRASDFSVANISKEYGNVIANLVKNE